MFKKAISISLSMLFLYLGVGYFLVFWSLEKQTKSEIKEIIRTQLSKYQIVEITINRSKNSEITWKDKNEFIYQNKMFDVVKTIENEHFTTYFCIEDKKEQQLYQYYAKHLENNIEPSSSKSKKLIKYKNNSFNLFIIYPNLTSIPQLTSNLISSKYCYYTSVFQDINSPPPRNYSQNYHTI